MKVEPSEDTKIEEKRKPDGILEENNRKPTDRFWLILFMICFLGYIVISSISIHFGMTKGGIYLDNRYGLMCGFDSSVLDKPKKIYIDERQCENPFSCNTKWICIGHCPKGEFDVADCEKLGFETIKKKIICENDEITKIALNCETLRIFIEDKRCVNSYKNTEDFSNVCYSEVTKALEIDDRIEHDAAHAYKRLSISLVCSILLAITLSCIFIVTLKWSAGCIFWTFLVLTGVGILAGIIGVGIGIANTKDHHGRGGLYAVLAVLCITFLAFIIILYFSRKKISCGIEMVKESSRAVCCSVASICFPILPYMIRIIFITFTFIAFLSVIQIHDNHYSVKRLSVDTNCKCQMNFSDGSVCDPHKFNDFCKNVNGGLCKDAFCGLNLQTIPKYCIPFGVLILFIGMWIVAFIQANAKMILGHVFGNWYWNFNRQFIPSNAVIVGMGKILKNHTGTAACGALIITICRILRFILSSRANSTNKCGIFGFVSLVLKCLCICAESLLKILEFITDKAFVLCAIQGSNFWQSVTGVSKIMATDIPLVIATKYVGDIILGLCKIVVALLAGVVFFFSLPTHLEALGISSDIKIISTIVMVILAYDLASVLFTSYHIAIDTLLICTIQRFTCFKEKISYFESESLNKLLLAPESA